MQDVVPAIRMECHSALCGDTPILMDDKIVSMFQIHAAHSAQGLNSFGILSGNIVETHIMEIPQEIMVPETVQIKFHFGLGIECSPGTLFLTIDYGFMQAEKLNKGDVVAVYLFNKENGSIRVEKGEIENIQKSSIIQVPKKAYLFVSETNNILIPYYKDGSSSIGFVCIKQ